MSVYKKGQVVWAKVRGYPWWPAVVNKDNQKKNGTIEKNLSLTFIGENKIGEVSLLKIKDYDANYKEFSASKNKKLLEAIKITASDYKYPRVIVDNTNTDSKEKQSVGKDESAEADKMEEEKEQENEDKEGGEEDSQKTVTKENKKESSFKKGEKKDSKGKGKKKEEEPSGNLVKKQNKKEEEKAAKYKDSIDLLQRRSTRSQSKAEKIEMFTEPLIYRDRSKGKKRDTDHDGQSQSAADNENSEDNEEEEEEEEIKASQKKPEREKNKGKKETKSTLGKRGLTEKKKKENKEEDDDEKEEEKEKEKEKKGAKQKNGPRKKVKMDNQANAGGENENEKEEGKDKTDKVNGKGKKESEVIDLEDDQEGSGESKKKEENLTDVEVKEDNSKAKDNVKFEKETGSSEQKNNVAKDKKDPNNHEASDKMGIDKRLEHINDSLVKKFKNKKNLNKEDEDYINLGTVISEFEGGAGSQNPNNVKLLESIHSLLSENKNLLGNEEAHIIEKLSKTIQNLRNTHHVQSPEEAHHENMRSPKHTDTNLSDFNSPAPKSTKSHEAKTNEAPQSTDVFLRKSVCLKLDKLLEEIYSMDKDSAQELTLNIEGRINSYFMDNSNDYKKAMKVLYKLMKAKMLKIQELRAIINAEYEEFKVWLQKKIQRALSPKKDASQGASQGTPQGSGSKQSPVKGTSLQKAHSSLSDPASETSMHLEDQKDETSPVTATPGTQGNEDPTNGN